MKVFMKSLSIAGALFLGCVSFAQESIEGIWTGKLEVAADTFIDVHFALSKNGAGNWEAILDSPDIGAIKNVPASAVSFDGAKLAVQVHALSGEYNGVLEGDAFTGEWTQPGARLPMNLTPFKAYVLAETSMATLLGQWHGDLRLNGNVEGPAVFYFERNTAGEFAGFADYFGRGFRSPMMDIRFDNDELFFRVPELGNEYRGTFVDGSFNGRMIQAPEEFELNVVKRDL